MSERLSAADEAAVQRRRFLRGGALLAAAAGGAVAAGATSAVPAAADSGQALRLGVANIAGTDTSLEASWAAVTTLKLLNSEGPALELPRDGDHVPLKVNQFAGTALGPLVAVKYEGSDVIYTDWIATSSDVSSLPVTYPVPNARILDTKKSAGRASIVNRSSSKALDSKGRLQKGAWIDVAVDVADEDYTPIAAFVVITSSGSTKDGALTAYIPDYDQDGTVAVSFIKKKTMSGSTYVGLNAVKGKQAFRLYASQTTYVAVDLTGITEEYDYSFQAGQNGRTAHGPRKAARRGSRRPGR